MTPPVSLEPLPPHGNRRPRSRDRWRRGRRQRTAASAGFTLVEVVVSSSILAMALAGSFRGWSQGQALVQQANQRQVLLDAVAQDLQRQQGRVIRKLSHPPWACEVSLAELKATLQAHPRDLPDGVAREWFRPEPSVLAIRYTAPDLNKPRERWLALGGGSRCEE